MKVLSDKRYSHVITWMPSGKSFNILKPKAFVAEILPEHFKTAKYSSFTRKLHRWGFSRHYRGEEAGAFYHKDFQRGRLDLVEQMTCHKAELPRSTAPVQKVAAERKVAAKKTPPEASYAPKKQVVVKKAAPTEPTKPSKAAQSPVAAKAQEEQVPMPSLPQQQQQAVSRLPAAQTAAQSSSAASALDAEQRIRSERLNAERLNAAIELEVNRRLKERINAVALQRQAFAVSALRQQQLAPSASQLAALALLKKQNAQLNTQHTPILNFSTMGYRALSTDGRPSAPPTNIQGARTA